MGTTAGGRGLARLLPIFKGFEGEKRERIYFNCIELHEAVNIRQPSTSRKAERLWKIREAMANGEAYYDQVSGRQMESRVAVKALWEAHQQSPVSAL